MSHAPAPFEHRTRIRFRHCDPAGIVFYPRYFELINDFVETWFELGLGISFHTLHEERSTGTPLATVQCDFKSPSRWNDVIVQTLAVRRIGNSSIDVEIGFAGEAGETRLQARLTIVITDLLAVRARPIPADLREALQRFLVPATADA